MYILLNTYNSVNKTSNKYFSVKYRDRPLIGAHYEHFLLSIQRNPQVNCVKKLYWTNHNVLYN